jgi:YegS/Rv2252/BmrU family lipid kinase
VNILLIVNPISGGRRAQRRRRDLEAVLARRGHEVIVRVTERPGDAARFAAATGASVERLLVAGGDGTLNEVVNGLGDRLDTPIAQLPTGTANLLGHEFELPRHADGVADLLESGVVRRLDLGTLDGHRFVSLASCGFDAMVTRSIKRTRSGSLGYGGHVRPILSTLRGYREPRLRVRVDAGDEVDAALVLVSNVRNYGGLFRVTDRALPDSGHLDVCVFSRASRLRLIRYAVAALRGRVSALSGVHYTTGKRIAIRSDEPVPVEVDGDYYGETPVEIGVIPGVLPILTPAP